MLTKLRHYGTLVLRDQEAEGESTASSDTVTFRAPDGTERTYTTEELHRLIEKGQGADKKFQEAAELRKQAEAVRDDNERARLVYERISNLDVDDPDALNVFGEILGATPEQVEQVQSIFQQIARGEEVTTPSSGSGGGSRGSGGASGPVTLESLDPRLQGLLRQVHQFMSATEKAGISNPADALTRMEKFLGTSSKAGAIQYITGLLDKNKKLGTLKGNPEKVAGLANLIYDRISKKVDEGETEWSERSIQKGVEEVTDILADSSSNPQAQHSQDTGAVQTIAGDNYTVELRGPVPEGFLPGNLPPAPSGPSQPRSGQSPPRRPRVTRENIKQPGSLNAIFRGKLAHDEAQRQQTDDS